MNATLDRCEACGALVDLEDLFCANCGREVPDRTAAESRKIARGGKGFGCKNCGASMSYDAGAQALRCPFCGSADLEADGSKGVLAPEIIIPFEMDQSAAEARLRTWLGSSFWHPSDLNAAAVVTEMRPVLVPYWVFRAEVETHWTADTGHTPPGASASWYPISGHASRHYDGLWVPASEGISTRELDAISPYDEAKGRPPESVPTDGLTVEQFSVSRRYARPMAQERIEAAERDGIAREIGGRSRNIRVSTILTDATSRAALAPVFVLAYRYRDRLYRFVMNGQTGTFSGQAPRSFRKLAAILLVVAMIVAGLVLVLH